MEKMRLEAFQKGVSEGYVQLMKDIFSFIIIVVIIIILCVILF